MPAPHKKGIERWRNVHSCLSGLGFREGLQPSWVFLEKLAQEYYLSLASRWTTAWRPLLKGWIFALEEEWVPWWCNNSRQGVAGYITFSSCRWKRGTPYLLLINSSGSIALSTSREPGAPRTITYGILSPYCASSFESSALRRAATMAPGGGATLSLQLVRLLSHNVWRLATCMYPSGLLWQI